MIPFLEKLIEALREELQQYGEMLARLDKQQDCVLRRAADELLQCVAEVESQGVVIRTARERRELCQQDLAGHLRLGAEAAFAQLIPRLPADYRPLMEALVAETNECLVRVRQRARQNHLLLLRSVELMQRFLSTVFPATDPATYDQSGQRASGLSRMSGSAEGPAGADSARQSLAPPGRLFEAIG